MKHSVGLSLILVCFACGKSDTKTTATAPSNLSHVTVTGSVLTFAFDPNAPQELAHVGIGMYNPRDILTNPNAQPPALGSASIDVTKCSNASGCPYGMEKVDMSACDIGAVVGVADMRTGDDAKLATVLTGVAPKSVTAAETTGDLTAAYAFAVSKATLGHLATSTGHTPESLVAQGAMIGIVSGKTLGSVVEGATVKGPAGFKIWYVQPGLAPSDGSDTATTSAYGLILAIPDEKKASFSEGWSVSAPQNPDLKWTVPALGTVPNFVLIAAFTPDP